MRTTCDWTKEAVEALAKGFPISLKSENIYAIIDHFFGYWRTDPYAGMRYGQARQIIRTMASIQRTVPDADTVLAATSEKILNTRKE